MKKSSPGSKKILRRSLLLHRRVGVALALFFIVLSITGIVLNHSTGLGLHDKPIRANWVFKWYGMAPEGEPTSYAIGEHTVTHWSGVLAWDGEQIMPAEDLGGAVELAGLMVASVDGELVLLSEAGELIEKISAASLPIGSLLQIGLLNGELLALQVDESFYHFDANMLNWSRLSTAEGIVWAQPVTTEAAIREQFLADYRGEGLSLYRIILDIHSGRFFGSWGPYFVDLVTVGLIFLTFTGLYNVVKKKAR